MSACTSRTTQGLGTRPSQTARMILPSSGPRSATARSTALTFAIGSPGECGDGRAARAPVDDEAITLAYGSSRRAQVGAHAPEGHRHEDAVLGSHATTETRGP